MVEKVEQANNENVNKAPKGKRKRSPNYPVVNLEQALKHAGDLFKSDNTHFVPIELIHERWGGLAKMGGRVLQLVAALKAYGLIEVEGQKDKRKVRVSDLAEKILDNHPKRQSLIREAALLPDIYSEIWNKYKVSGLPKDDVFDQALRWGEGLDFQFENKEARELLIRNFTQTIKFAKLDSIDEEESEFEEKELPSSDDHEALTDNEQMTQANNIAKLPLGNEEFATFNIPTIGFLKIVYPITKKQLQIVRAILNAIDVSDPETKIDDASNPSSTEP